MAAANAPCTTCALHRLAAVETLQATTRAALRQRIVSNRQYAPGAYLFRQGEPCRAFKALHHGAAKAVVIDPNGAELILDFYLAGDLIHESVACHGSHAESVLLLEPADVCELPITAVQDLIGRDQAAAAAILHALEQAVNVRSQTLGRLGQGSADRRVAAFLTDLRARYLARGGDGTAFRLPMSRYDMGAFLELAPETVSRAMQRLQEAGIVRVAGKRVQIVDPPALAHRAGGDLAREPDVDSLGGTRDSSE